MNQVFGLLSTSERLFMLQTTMPASVSQDVFQQLPPLQAAAGTAFRLLAPNAGSSGIAPKNRAILISFALLAAAICFGLWGMSLNTTSTHAALVNLVKVPVLIFASGLASVPFALVLLKLFGPSSGRVSNLLVAYALALLGGSTVLLVASPLVGIYQHSTSSLGMSIAVSTAVLGVITMGILFVRVLRKLSDGDVSLFKSLPPAIVLMAVQLAVLAQLSSVTTPVFNTRTSFGHGIDNIHGEP
jgi:hypothetical protein